MQLTRKLKRIPKWEKASVATEGHSTVLLTWMLPLSTEMLPMRRWREDGKCSGDILDWKSWQVLPSRYVMFQGIGAAADEEHSDLPPVFLQVLQHSQKDMFGLQHLRVLGCKADLLSLA